MRKPNKRFSYLLLDEGEFYVQDWMTVCRSGLVGLRNAPSQSSSQQLLRLRGRLRLCSRSIFFEPDDISIPIVMFPFNKLKKIEGISEPPMSPSPVLSKWSRRQEAFLLETTVFVKMKEGGLDAPYVFEKQESKWWFSLEFAPVQQFLLQAQSLLSINRLPPPERDMILRNSMAQKEAQGRFDTSRLNDLNEGICLDCPVAQIIPLVREPGRLVLTQTHLYFQPLHNLNNDSPVRTQHLSSIVAVARRRHALCHTGLELFFAESDSVSRNTLGSKLSDCGSAFFTFRTTEERETFASELLRQLKGFTNSDDGTGHLLEADGPWLDCVMHAWQAGKVSNFDYLIYLNLAAGRSFCDLTQWPVMPWIITDYKSEVLDLSKSSIFRDLSKPIGALNAERLTIYKERYAQMMEDGGSDHPFLYGTHYSTPGYVLYWLVRSAPAHMLRLQNGRFDAPDRLFVSLKESWESVLNNPADLKELIPEFFSYPGDFLVMREGLNLGVKQGGEVVGDVLLPPWAKNPTEFIKIHQEALESEYVSKDLHLWIDLIFGYKQRGEAAIASDNLFHHLTYEGSVDLESISDPVERASLEAQIHEFGQAPLQLFLEPHPARLAKSTVSGDALRDGSVLYGEAFRGVNPNFFSRIMAAITADSIKESTSFVLLRSKTPVPLPVAENSESAEDILSHSAPYFDTLVYQESTEAEVPNKSCRNPTDAGFSQQQRSIRPASLKASDGERFLRLESAKSGFQNWDYWSPGSNSGTELDNSECNTPQVLDLKKEPESMISLTGLAKGTLILDNMVTERKEECAEDAFEKVQLDNEMLSDLFSKSTSLQLHRGPVKAVILSEENASESLTLYSAGQDGFLKVYSVGEGLQMRATRLGNLPLSVLALAGSCDQYPIVLAGSYDHCLYAYSVDYGRQIGKIQVHEETVSCVKLVDHSLQRLVTASWDATVKVWTMEEGRGGWSTGFGMVSSNNEPACIPESQFLEHEGAIFSLDVEQDGYLVVSGEADGTIIAWDIRNPTSIVWKQCGLVRGPVMGIRLLPEGSKVVIASGEGLVSLLDMKMDGASLLTYDCKSSLKCVEATSDILFAGGGNGQLHIYPNSYRQQTSVAGINVAEVPVLDSISFQDHTEAINSISLCLDCRRLASSLATASDDGCIQLYRLEHK